MPARHSTVFFLSDYGLDDEFVGVVKAVIHRAASHAQVMDLTHGITPQDVRAGALSLVRAGPFLFPSVVLAVVDPGVGTDRRCLAVELDDGSVLVGPDNGLLFPLVQTRGGASRAVVLSTTPDRHRGGGPTFAGREVLAPAVAEICNGIRFELLGEEIDPSEIVPLELPHPHTEGNAVRCEAIWIDRYGNVQVSAKASDLPAQAPGSEGSPLVVRTGSALVNVRRVSAFAELQPSEVGILVDSAGLLSVVVNAGSAARRLEVEPGDELVIERQPGPGSSP